MHNFPLRNKKVGIFRLSFGFIDDDRGTVLELFSRHKIIVISAQMFDWGIEYVGISDLFEEVREWDVPGFYSIIEERRGSEVIFSARKDISTQFSPLFLQDSATNGMF